MKDEKCQNEEVQNDILQEENHAQENKNCDEFCDEFCEAASSETSNEMLALQAKLDEANKKAAEFKDAFVRANADFDNYKKRLEKDKQNAILFAQEGLLKDLLPVLDALDAAINCECESDEAKQLNAGVQNTNSLLLNTLAKHGIKMIEVKAGDEFDPELHECMMRANADEPNRIVQVFSKGYLLNDRVIRASKVSVSQ